MKKIFFLFVVGLLMPCLTAEAIANNLIYVKTPSKVSVFFPCEGYKTRYIRVDLDFFCNSRKRTKLWRLTKAYDVEREGDYIFANRLSQEFIYPGEWECAFMQLKDGHRMPDFTGGFHGYEELSEVGIWQDGNPLNLGISENGKAEKIVFKQKSLMYEYGTNIPIAEHLKELTFSKNGINVIQKITWLKEIEIDNIKMAMLPIARSLSDGTQITDHLVIDDSDQVYDVSRSDHTVSIGGANVHKVRIWGLASQLYAEMEVNYEPRIPGNKFFCSMYTPQDGYNKLYFDFCDKRVVSKGEIWMSDVQYRLGVCDK